MKHFYCLLFVGLSFVSASAADIEIDRNVDMFGWPKPIPVAISGFSGEVDSVLTSDLMFMGIARVSAEEAKYLISGSNNGRVEGRVVEKFNKNQILGKAYTGSTMRGQTHAFADDICQAITGRPGIAQTKIVFKAETGSANSASEVYISDYDGKNARAVTQDGSSVAAPCWGDKGTLFYTTYKLGLPFIYSHQLNTGTRLPVAKFSGLNTSPAVSPDGQRVAMILSKSGSPDLYVANRDGSNLRQLTTTREPESSPCWSPDGQNICYVSRERGPADMYVISPNGGKPRRLPANGAPNPSEPDWSPDGKWIVFTSLMGQFQICLVRAGGGDAIVLTAGEDPSWAPNSRAVIYCKGRDHAKTLSLLDVPTKRVKDIARILESNSQPSWAKF